MFTGKNKEQFEKWYKDVYFYATEMRKNYNSFTKLHFTMQQGVYLEYLDSVEIEVDCFKDVIYEEESEDSFWWGVGEDIDGHEPTRQEALTEAFKKADELINKI